MKRRGLKLGRPSMGIALLGTALGVVVAGTAQAQSQAGSAAPAGSAASARSAAPAGSAAPTPKADSVASEADAPADVEGAAGTQDAVDERVLNEAESSEQVAGSAQAAGSAEAAESAGVPSREEFEALKAELARLQERQDEAEVAAVGADTEPTLERDILSIYGFLDMGVQRYWTSETSLAGALYNTNALTFAVGNVDLYFDINPVEDWRGLAEVRFTAAPHGEINNYGGLAGTFDRENTLQNDPHSIDPNAPMWGGRVVIERAWIEWNRLQAFRVRTGSFFTPFGIWNVDHGSPTLISISMPQFIQQRWLPIRQVGVQALGSFFFGEWEFGYRAWLTNGRQELSSLDFDDDKAFGARLLLNRQTGTVNTMFGASFHHGRVTDQSVNVTGLSPITFDKFSTFAYNEQIFGVDASIDIDDFRARSEFMVRQKIYDEGERQLTGFAMPGAYQPDGYQTGGYLTLAYQLPWFGLEPYAYGEIMQQMWEVGDLTVVASGGLNVRFTPSTMLKLQATQAFFFDWRKTSEGDPSDNNIAAGAARLVMAF